MITKAQKMEQQQDISMRLISLLQPADELPSMMHTNSPRTAIRNNDSGVDYILS